MGSCSIFSWPSRWPNIFRQYFCGVPQFFLTISFSLSLFVGDVLFYEQKSLFVGPQDLSKKVFSSENKPPFILLFFYLSFPQLKEPGLSKYTTLASDFVVISYSRQISPASHFNSIGHSGYFRTKKTKEIYTCL